MKAIELKDKGIKIVYLPMGTYSINGKIIETTSYNETEVEVDSFDNICPVTRKNIIKYYINSNEEKMSVSDYLKEEDSLSIRHNGKGNDEYGYIWKSLDAEFAYRKFKELWQPIYTTIEEKGDPISFAIQQSTFDTKCPFIKNAFLLGKDGDSSVFVYERASAWLDIVNKCFDKLGMEYRGDIDYSQTRDKKIWGNARHSCIRYITAFGTYVMSSAWDTPSNIRGTLDEMLAKYNADKAAIEKILISQYNIHFGAIDQKSFDFKRLNKELATLKSSMKSITPKKGEIIDYNIAVKQLNGIIDFVQESFKSIEEEEI